MRYLLRVRQDGRVTMTAFDSEWLANKAAERAMANGADFASVEVE